jgi:hypothetical protein
MAIRSIQSQFASGTRLTCVGGQLVRWTTSMTAPNHRGAKLGGVSQLPARPLTEGDGGWGFH